MRADLAVITRVLTSYKMMLDFYGFRLVDDETGLLDRVLPPRNYEPRYRNLVRELFAFTLGATLTQPNFICDLTESGHNNLRISRILKHLSEMGLEYLNAGFLLHVLNEQSENQELQSSFLKSSMDRWWARCIRNDEERAFVGGVIGQVRREELLFTRDMYEKVLQNRKEYGKLSLRTNDDTSPMAQ